MKKFKPFSLMITALMLSVLACSLPLIGDVETNEWYVSTEGSDSNSCTLESQACRTIQGALDKTEGANGIVHVAPGTYTENVSITSSITIIGAGRELTIVDGGAAGSVFDLVGGRPWVTVWISGLTVQNGRKVDGNGGGIHARMVTLNVVDSIIRDNAADRYGGGLFTVEGLANLDHVVVTSNDSGRGCSIANYGRGPMDLLETEVTGNTTSGVCNFGARDMTIRNSHIALNGETGIVNHPNAQLTVSGSEIANNGDPSIVTAGIDNAGILNVNDSHIHNEFYGILNSCQATVVDSTINDSGSGIRYFDSSSPIEENCPSDYPDLIVRNSTISGNFYGIHIGWERSNRFRIVHATIAFNDYGIYTEYAESNSEVAAVVNSILDNRLANCAPMAIPGQGKNLDSDGSCDFHDWRGHLNNVDPHLEPLADNGGSTPPHRMMLGSPVIDSAFDFWCPPTDQRGVGRPVGGGCEIGAYEAVWALSATTPEEDDVVEILEATITPEPALALPIAINFNADSYSILAGKCTRLRWQVDNADQIALDGQDVPALNAEQVCPTSITTYWLTAENADDQEEAFVTIEVTEPAVVPKAPAQLTISSQVCTAQSYTVTLNWIDTADNEDGYRIYRDGTLIDTVGPNAKGYSDNPPYGGPYTYGVESFNSSGSSSRPTVEEAGCIF